MNSQALLERARLLMGQNRLEQAAELLRQVLASDPNSAESHALLALCLTKDKDQWHEATREAEMAVHLAPDSAFVHYVLAVTFEKRNRFADALSSVREATQLDPYDSAYHRLAASVLAQQERWDEALASATKGLEVNPEDEGCSALRSLCLERLGRTEDAMAEATAAVARNPNSAEAHATRGWAQLNQGDHRAAQESFREALRLDPTYEFARSGMIQSLNNNHLLFRLMFRFYSFVGRMAQSAQWMLLIGLFVGMRVLRGLAQTYPALAPFVTPISFLYIGFCLLSWIANPLFNTFLRFHPFGKFLLSKKETWASSIVAVLLALGMVFGIYRCVVGDIPGGIVGGLCVMFLMMPVATAFEVDGGWPLAVAIVFCVGLGFLALVITSLIAINGNWILVYPAYMIGILIFSFAGNALRQVTVRH